MSDIAATRDVEMTEFLDGMEGVVDATSYESLCIWREYHEELKKPWASNFRGYLETVGRVGDMPVCVSLSKTIVDGCALLFIEPTSQMVDHRMIDEWLEKNMPETAFRDRGNGRYLNRVNAMNFHNVFRHPSERSAASPANGG